MRVKGGGGTEQSAMTAEVGVTYWATEFERVYVMTAARIRGKRALIRRCSAGLGTNHRASQSERSACSLGSRAGADSGGGGAAPSESANRSGFTGRQPGLFSRNARFLRPAPHRANHRDVPTLTGQRRAEASLLWKSPLPDPAEEPSVTVGRPRKSSGTHLTGYSNNAMNHDMMDEQTPPAGALVGEGASNKNATLQRAAAPLIWKQNRALVFFNMQSLWHAVTARLSSMSKSPSHTVLRSGPTNIRTFERWCRMPWLLCRENREKGSIGRYTLMTLPQNCSKTTAYFRRLQSDW
jgi:hypothetical protein